MLKAKLKDFKISIRRQQKDKIFAGIRKEQQQITRMEQVLGKISELDLIKQNFEIFWVCFKEINTYIIDFSKNGSKGSILDVGKIFQEGMENSFNPLKLLSHKYSQLTSEAFKKLVLDLFEQVYKVKKGKINNLWSQISEKLLLQLTLMNGILFKEPESLALLFPFNSIKEYIHDKKQDPEKVFESSFQLFQKNLSYLKQNFQSIVNQPENSSINFLTIVHSISTTLQFFVVNIEQIKKKTLKNGLNLDDQKMIYLVSLLKSHNFENYLQEVLQELINRQNKDQTYNFLNEIPIFLSLLSMINRYCQFIQFGRFSTQTLFFSSKVKKFHSFILKGYFSKNKTHFLQIKVNVFQYDDSSLHKNTTCADIRVIFQLYFLACQSVLSFNQKDTVPLCDKMIQYLLICADKVQYESNNYQKLCQKQSSIPFSEFYLKVLIAQQGERWIHFLQVLTSMQSLVKNYNISLEDLMNYALEENTQFSEAKIVKFFEDMSYCIMNISGYFQNERHLFLQSLVTLFVIWKHNSFQKGFFMWDCEFWIKITQCLYRLIDEIQFSTKGNEDKENQNRYPIIILLEDLRKLVDLTVEQTRNSPLDHNIEIDI